MKKLITTVLVVLILGTGMGLGSDSLSAAPKPTSVSNVEYNIGESTSIYDTLAKEGNLKTGVQYKITSTPSGKVVADGSSGYFTYTPPTTEVFKDSFTFEVLKAGKSLGKGTATFNGGVAKVVVPEPIPEPEPVPVPDPVNLNINLDSSSWENSLWLKWTEHFGLTTDSDFDTIKFNGQSITANNYNNGLNTEITGLTLPEGVLRVQYQVNSPSHLNYKSTNPSIKFLVQTNANYKGEDISIPFTYGSEIGVINLIFPEPVPEPTPVPEPMSLDMDLTSSSWDNSMWLKWTDHFGLTTDSDFNSILFNGQSITANDYNNGLNTEITGLTLPEGVIRVQYQVNSPSHLNYKSTNPSIKFLVQTNANYTGEDISIPYTFGSETGVINLRFPEPVPEPAPVSTLDINLASSSWDNSIWLKWTEHFGLATDSAFDTIQFNGQSIADSNYNSFYNTEIKGLTLPEGVIRVQYQVNSPKNIYGYQPAKPSIKFQVQTNANYNGEDILVPYTFGSETGVIKLVFPN